MPDMTPVAQNVVPPNPMQGINTLSGMLGLQQQRQQLGQQTAETNQAKQRDAEMQRAQAIVVHGAQSGTYSDGEGGLDRQKMANDILRVAPTYGQPIISTLLSQANEIMSNKQAHQNLNADQQKQMGSTFGALATKQDLTTSDVTDALETLRGVNRSPEFSRMLTSMGMHLPPNAGTKALQDQMRRWSIAATSPESAEGQSAPNVTMVQGQEGLNATNVNPQAPGGVGPVGPPQAQGVAPGIVTAPSGQLARTGSSGSLSPLATTPDLNPTRAQQIVNTGAAEGLTTRVQQAQAAANNTVQAQDALSRARAILDNPSSPDTGALFNAKKSVKNFLSGVGIDTGAADDANTLVKNLARYEASRATQAGLGGTDAARELAHNGSPNVSLDNAALKGIVTQSLATEKALASYANIQTKTKDAGQLAKNEAAFRNIPHLIQAYEYGLARTPAEAEEFLKKHGLTRAEMGAARKAIREFEAR